MPCEGQRAALPHCFKSCYIASASRCMNTSNPLGGMTTCCAALSVPYVALVTCQQSMPLSACLLPLPPHLLAPQSDQLLRLAQSMYGCGLRDTSLFTPLAAVLRQRAATTAAGGAAAGAMSAALPGGTAATAGAGGDIAAAVPAIPARILQASWGPCCCPGRAARAG